ncbi:hypothetical protein JM81_2749 [Maribacter sp. MAR_2009_72]|nr:hypothetical protein JM81_2749 [Maribacter sp. MAR_2009_72]
MNMSSTLKFGKYWSKIIVVFYILAIFFLIVYVEDFFVFSIWDSYIVVDKNIIIIGLTIFMIIFSYLLFARSKKYEK